MRCYTTLILISIFFAVGCASNQSAKIVADGTIVSFTVPDGWKIHYTPKGTIPSGITLIPEPAPMVEDGRTVSLLIRSGPPMYSPPIGPSPQSIQTKSGELHVLHGESSLADYYSISIKQKKTDVMLTIAKSDRELSQAAESEYFEAFNTVIHSISQK
jgi:hypothetical protein